uniref:Pentatricopeptide repeat-containing protein, chloroplastic n=1 Tax=Alexandrium monilatum TaxID=311494 RepID=A0A7S4S719_9DINO
MRGSAVGPNTTACNSALSVCQRSTRWASALHTLALFRAYGVQHDLRSYAIAMSACARGVQWAAAILLLTAANAGALRPNLVVHNVLISACEKGMRWERALQLAVGLASRSLTPDLITYSASISACEKGWQWSHALALYADMRQAGRVQPDVPLCSALISACAKGGQWEMALGLRRSMQQDSLAPDLIAHNAALEACVEGARWREAVFIVHGMVLGRTVLGAVSCRSLLSACEGSGANGHRAQALLGLRGCLARLLQSIGERSAWERAAAFGDKANVFGLAAEAEDILAGCQLIGHHLGATFHRTIGAPVIVALRRDALTTTVGGKHGVLEVRVLERQFGLGNWSSGCALDELGLAPARRPQPRSAKARRQLHAALLHGGSDKHTQGSPRTPVATHLATHLAYALRLRRPHVAAVRSTGGLRPEDQGSVLGYRGLRLAGEGQRRGCCAA